jgi:hypothetical protein
MNACIIRGSVSLDPCGLVAVMPCGHWWTYPVHASVEQMHEVARFNRGLACGSCITGGHASADLQTPGTATRVN